MIDRINLYFKGNSSIPFSDEERVWVNRTENTKSFQDVTDLATELYEYCSEKQDEKELDQMPELNLDDLKVLIVKRKLNLKIVMMENWKKNKEKIR